MILSQGDTLKGDETLAGIKPSRSKLLATSANDVEDESQHRQRQRHNIILALEKSGGKVFGDGGAAILLGVKPTTLASRIKKLNIDTRYFKNL